MKKTKVIFNNYILDHEIRIDDEVIECVQEYIYLAKKIGACPDYEKQIKKTRIGMEWSAFGTQHSVMKSNFALSLKRKMYNQCILPILTWIRNLKYYESLGMKTSSAPRGMETIMVVTVRRISDHHLSTAAC